MLFTAAYGKYINGLRLGKGKSAKMKILFF